MDFKATSRADDLYCFENRRFHQIGTIKHRAIVNLDLMKPTIPQTASTTTQTKKKTSSKPSKMKNSRVQVSTSSGKEFVSSKFKRTDDSPLITRKRTTTDSTFDAAANLDAQLKNASGSDSEVPTTSAAVVNSSSSVASQATTVMPESPRSDLSSYSSEDEEMTEANPPNRPNGQQQPSEEPKPTINPPRSQPPKFNTPKVQPRNRVPPVTYIVKVGASEFKPQSLILTAVQKGIDLEKVEADLPKITKIDTVEQYNQLRKEFQDKYVKYKELDQILNGNVEEFKKFESEWKSLETEEEKNMANAKIQELFARRKMEVGKLTKVFNALHKELESTKRLIKEYSDNARNGTA